MSIHVALNHVTHYKYDRPVSLGPQVVRLRPCPHSRTRILSYSLKVLPAKHFINWQQDPQSNYLARLAFPDKTQEFRVEVDLVAEMAVHNPFDFFLEPDAENYPLAYNAEQCIELAPYLHRMSVGQGLGERFAAYLGGISREKRRTIDFLVDLNARLQQDISYLIRLEPGVQTPEETLENGSGSCRDSAWLLVQLLRHLGLAARFVSGYLIQLTADVKSLDGPSGPEADFTDLHAWCEVYLPGAGWIGLDPTSGLLAGEGHIPLACSPEPSSAAPISGMVEDCACDFSHAMKVERIWEAPRVTKPYTEAQWAEIEALGHAIDKQLDAHDVRLTMGGEPTFVSMDDPDGDEWNTTAMGPTKRLLAADLYHRLREKYGAQGLMHFGQGKWYPGEQLPRWSLNAFWRRDGEPMWRDAALYADEGSPGSADERVANRFLCGVAERLGLDTRHVFDAFEDVFYYLWRERRLPVNVDPFDARLDDPLERERLLRVFSHGLPNAVGAVLPVARDTAGRWTSGPWFLRGDRCYLIPGDSPLGYRLPLDSQPWVSKGDYPYMHQPDPNQVFAPLPQHTELRRPLRGQPEGGATAADRFASDAALSARAPQPGESAAAITRTAMCAQAREGTLYIFMPPTAALDDYLAIVAAVEATAEALGQPVILEGYEPPSDPRLAHFRITPDPGVIEVNIHPAHSWDELVDRTTHLYEAARESRLLTEKFMLDGRHSGTGGGNHFVLGGATPVDSPFLRRPDLLRSLIAYWHNHPSLSYLFSGLFVGPTSQAPRIDEARNDSVYEIELAFREMERQIGSHGPEQCPPWLVDRLLRNLLIDVSGNTHRAEFCIDKLYSPDGPTGRLGLLELRAFEMPPHARMSLTQQLLLRGLVARFWQQPYAPERLVRWGTELHDRFMLPHFVEQDFGDVIAELNEFGLPIEVDWFAPHFEFRFPKVGDFSVRGIEVQLRHALEPWHVMGEEGGAGSTVRYVDSSLERLQVKVSGMAPDRYVLAVNGVPLPLQPIGTVGEAVAGVRYRAWQPASCLHPTIGVDAPLVFDLIDTWMKRSLGGAQYHVAHPGGRNYDSFPVNAFEAESRRLARFFRMGHTPGGRPVDIETVQRNAEFPFTLDLRGVPKATP
ncbi:transglutaminase domain-containing protein [Azoarcus sp. CIB]|uniref:transglutaminase family protein n=1 Tax=Aromatoleum sp. (strain CIB) TaxID=198107 RepID=UPI00067BB37C|nr:transglutaminase family protein [Azoarcus sp. CIB]AKU13145.1 transglutaminase domain-containing protein [Azoarcus sp. CIB]